MIKFLDNTGLAYFWEKIKALIPKYTIKKLNTPTAGYRESYRLEKNDESDNESNIINIPTEFTPLVSKEYLDNTFYSTNESWENASRYFMCVTPDASKTYWYIKYRVRVWIPADTTDYRFTDSIIEYFGSGVSMKGYRIWNTINTGSAAYYQVAYWLTETGLSNDFGHVIGTSILYGTNYRTDTWYRYVKLDLLVYEGCSVEVFDELTKWAPYKQSIGATDSDYGTTTPSTYNATSQGLQETGDTTDTSSMYLPYARFTAGAYGMMNRSLIMQDGQGKWQSFTTSSGTSATKTKNPSGFRLGSNIYHLGSTTDYAANAILSTSLVRAFVPLIDLRYSLNITTTSGGANNLVPYKPLYIVGTIGNDGLFYLDDAWWTQNEPSTENGKIYIKVCPAIYNDYSTDRCYRGDLDYSGDAYWYKDGLFKRYYVDKKELTAGTDLEIVPVINQSRLPEGYIELEYIESTGTQYIDTGKNFLFGDEFYFDYLTVQDYSSEDRGYGAGTSTSTNNITGGGRKSGNNIKLYCIGSQSDFSPVLTAAGSRGTRFIEQWKITDGKLSATLTNSVNGNVRTIEYSRTQLNSSYDSENSVYLFRDHLDNYAYYSKLRIYSTWLKRQSGDYAFNYVPAKRISDNEIGFYDLVSETFKTNDGTENFIAGKEVSLYTGVDRINFTNTSGYALQSSVSSDLSRKADKVTSATSGNFAGLDANGNLTDSGHKHSDYATADQGILASTAYQKPSTGIPKTDLDSSVQTSLNKAETALQTHQDISGKIDKISSTDNAIARFDGTNGDVQDSGVLISDDNDLLTPGNITAGGNNVYIGSTSGSQCHMQYDNVNKCLKFVFN